MSDLELTNLEKKLITKYLFFYQAIEAGSSIGDNSGKFSQQKRDHFLDVCHGLKKPKTLHERAYLKWKKLQEEKPPKIKKKQQNNRPTGFWR